MSSLDASAIKYYISTLKKIKETLTWRTTLESIGENKNTTRAFENQENILKEIWLNGKENDLIYQWAPSMGNQSEPNKNTSRGGGVLSNLALYDDTLGIIYLFYFAEFTSFKKAKKHTKNKPGDFEINKRFYLEDVKTIQTGVNILNHIVNSVRNAYAVIVSNKLNLGEDPLLPPRPPYFVLNYVVVHPELDLEDLTVIRSNKLVPYIDSLFTPVIRTLFLLREVTINIFPLKTMVELSNSLLSKPLKNTKRSKLDGTTDNLWKNIIAMFAPSKIALRTFLKKISKMNDKELRTLPKNNSNDRVTYPDDLLKSVKAYIKPIEILAGHENDPGKYAKALLAITAPEITVEEEFIKYLSTNFSNLVKVLRGTKSKNPAKD